MILVASVQSRVCPNYAYCVFFFFNDTATTEIYTLSLHDALPISRCRALCSEAGTPTMASCSAIRGSASSAPGRPSTASPASRSEEHTSELQSPCNLVCRLLLEKKNRAGLSPTIGLLRHYDFRALL